MLASLWCFPCFKGWRRYRLLLGTLVTSAGWEMGMVWPEVMHGTWYDIVHFHSVVFSFKLWSLNTKCLLNEGELIKLVCTETDTVLAGAAWIQYQILDSFIMYSFLMQETQLVLEVVRFAYDSSQYSPHHSTFCTLAGWLLEGGKLLGLLIPLALPVSDKATLICILCSLRAGLLGLWKWVIFTLFFNSKFVQGSLYHQRVIY